MDKIKEESLEKVNGGLAMENNQEIHGYRVNENCISCGACIGACPVEAIKIDDYEAVIDQEICVQCGYCADECPTEAIQKF